MATAGVIALGNKLLELRETGTREPTRFTAIG